MVLGGTSLASLQIPPCESVFECSLVTFAQLSERTNDGTASHDLAQFFARAWLAFFRQTSRLIRDNRVDTLEPWQVAHLMGRGTVGGGRGEWQLGRIVIRHTTQCMVGGKRLRHFRTSNTMFHPICLRRTCGWRQPVWSIAVEVPVRSGKAKACRQVREYGEG